MFINLNKKMQFNYKQNDMGSFSNRPLSLQIYKTLENIKLLARFAESVMEKHCYSRYFSFIYNSVEEESTVYEGYLKGVAVSELNAILKNPALSDKDAIQAFEDHLNNGITLELLNKNRQSKNERDLKFLSIISIFIGIGIFTTLGLVCKRLYDSGGTSINFFKPLSQNLYETFTEITSEPDVLTEIKSQQR